MRDKRATTPLRVPGPRYSHFSSDQQGFLHFALIFVDSLMAIIPRTRILRLLSSLMELGEFSCTRYLIIPGLLHIMKLYGLVNEMLG